jgi:hypothetical protein
MRRPAPAPVTVTYANGRKETRPPDSFTKQGARGNTTKRKPRPHPNQANALLKYAEYLRLGGLPEAGRGRKLRAKAARTCTKVTLTSCEEAMRP